MCGLLTVTFRRRVRLIENIHVGLDILEHTRFAHDSATRQTILPNTVVVVVNDTVITHTDCNDYQ